MNCIDAENLLDSYLDGQLNGSLRLEFEAHRLRCRRCQQTLAMMETAAHVIATDRRMPVLPDDFTERVLSRVAARPARRLRLSPGVVAGALLAQAAAIGLFFLVRGPGGPTPPAEPASAGLRPNPSLGAGALHFDALRARVDQREDAYEAVMRGLAAGIRNASESGRPIRPEWLELAEQYVSNFQIPESLARQSLDLAGGHAVPVLMDVLVPSPAAESAPADTEGRRYSL
jgi:hypothetical protein